MKVTYSYRGNVEVVATDFLSPELGLSGCVSAQQNKWSDGREKVVKVTIEADELLKMAKACLQQLSEISGVGYAVCVKTAGASFSVLWSQK